MHKYIPTHNSNAHLAANMWLLMMGIDELETTVVECCCSHIPHLLVFPWVYSSFNTIKKKTQCVVIWCWVWCSQSLRGLSTDQTKLISKYPSERACSMCVPRIVLLLWFFRSDIANARPVDKIKRKHLTRSLKTIDVVDVLRVRLLVLIEAYRQRYRIFEWV